MRKIYQILPPFLDELSEKRKAYYGRDLIAAIVFGAYARGEVSFGSDLDILIVLKECSLNRSQRQRVFGKHIEDQVSGKNLLPISPIIIET